MDRLRFVLLGLFLLAAVACSSGGGGTAHARVRSSVQVLQIELPAPGSLGRCLALTAFRRGRVMVVQRVGSLTRSLTITQRGSSEIFACDRTGVRLEGREWCGVSAGRLRKGRVTDPRLGLLCRDGDGRHVAAAFVNPVRGARWIAVDQGPHTELYPTAARLPVRIASTRGVDYPRARAIFRIEQLDARGRALVRSTLVARVAG